MEDKRATISTTTMSNLFRSDRLVFRAIEDDDNDKRTMHRFQTDALNLSLSGLGNIKPKSKASTGKWLDFISTKPSLGVWICLPVNPEDISQEERGKAGEAEFAKSREWSLSTTPIDFICLADDGNHVGLRGGMVAICLFEEYTGKGYGTEAINWVLDWAFKQGNMHVVRIGTIGFNTRAQQCYEKMGFKLDGRRRDYAYFERAWWDLLDYSMLEGEWEKLRGIGQ